MTPSCPFCSLSAERVVDASALCLALFDLFPASPGHTLIIPKRHVASWFEATAEEQAELLTLAARAKARLDRDLRPDGYNLGVNVGEAAGQTVMHLHLHVIPRYRGDTPDPTGGVRGVLPGKMNYLK